MKIYTPFCIVFQFYIGASIEIKPKLQRNILNFGYGINYKYEGILVHSFDRFHVVIKFMLPMIGDLKFSKLDFDYTCAYRENENAHNTESRRYMLELKAFCIKVRPFVTYYNKIINSYNNTNHNILEKEKNCYCPKLIESTNMELSPHWYQVLQVWLLKVCLVSFNISTITTYIELSVL